jgi:YegS/Rv2252/BmrU family lipid kinase
VTKNDGYNCRQERPWVFIVNPIAGNGYGAACVQTVRDMMHRHGVAGEVVLTRDKGHATELAAAYADKGFPVIVGVGGDGTMAEVAQALVGRADVTFGAVAAGTGNDFIHILGFPDRFTDRQWQALFDGATQAMDVGRCNGRYFINGMGLGVDAQIAAENYDRVTGKVKPGSKAKYTWMIVKNLLFYREKMMKVTLDGKVEEHRTFLNTIANGRRLAAGLQLTPRAFANDGLLDICTTLPLGLFKRFGIFGEVKKAAHLKNPAVRYFQTARIEYEFSDEVPAHLDGELIFSRSFKVDVLPGALRTIFDPHGEHYFRV